MICTMLEVAVKLEVVLIQLHNDEAKVLSIDFSTLLLTIS